MYSCRCQWTQTHFRWLERQRFEAPVQQVVFQKIVDAVLDARHQVAALEGQIRLITSRLWVFLLRLRSMGIPPLFLSLHSGR